MFNEKKMQNIHLVEIWDSDLQRREGFWIVFIGLLGCDTVFPLPSCTTEQPVMLMTLCLGRFAVGTDRVYSSSLLSVSLSESLVSAIIRKYYVYMVLLLRVFKRRSIS